MILKRTALVGMLGVVGLVGCGSVEDRKNACEDLVGPSYERCRAEAVDPRWEEAEGKLLGLEGATTAEEKRRAECNALLNEADVAKCLAAVKSPKP